MCEIDIYEMMKKYGVCKKIQDECSSKGLDKSPHDERAVCQVRRQHFDEVWRQKRKKRVELLKATCKMAPDYICSDLIRNSEKNCCKQHCAYYRDNIAVVDQEMEELKEIDKLLDKCVIVDEGCK